MLLLKHRPSTGKPEKFGRRSLTKAKQARRHTRCERLATVQLVFMLKPYLGYACLTLHAKHYFHKLDTKHCKRNRMPENWPLRLTGDNTNFSYKIFKHSEILKVLS